MENDPPHSKYPSPGSPENELIGNEIVFPVPKEAPPKKPAHQKLLSTFLTGFFLIVGVVMSLRCSFFIDAGFADGVVEEIIPVRKTIGSYFDIPVVAFFTNENKMGIIFEATDNLPLEKGEWVKVIYKKNNPGKAAVYSFFGFWFNSILAIMVLLFFWTAGLIVYYGDYPKAKRKLRFRFKEPPPKTKS